MKIRSARARRTMRRMQVNENKGKAYFWCPHSTLSNATWVCPSVVLTFTFSAFWEKFSEKRMINEAVEYWSKYIVSDHKNLSCFCRICGLILFFHKWKRKISISCPWLALSGGFFYCMVYSWCLPRYGFPCNTGFFDTRESSEDSTLFFFL